MMKMDGRDSAEYRIWVMKGHNGHLEVCLSHKKTKMGIVTCLLKFKRGENMR